MPQTPGRGQSAGCETGPILERYQNMPANDLSAPPPGGGAKILIVEDEFLIRLTLSEVLADEGYQVLEADCGADALQILQDEPQVAVLLTDIHLAGGRDGHVVAKRAREMLPNLPVIFMTGAADTVTNASPGGRDKYLAKPYLPAEMCAAVRQMLTG